MNEVRDKWRNMCRDAKQKFAEHRREAKRTGGGPPPTPLSQTVTETVDMYKDCSSFMGIPGGMETFISSETDMTARCDDSQTPSFGLTIIEVPAEELSNSSKVSNQSSSDYVSVSQRPISPATGCSNATPPVMTDTTSCKRNSTDKSKQEKAKPKKKSAEDVYALQCAVLEKELEKNNLQIEFLNILLRKAKREEELTVTDLFSSLL
ncbi:uncharacterized protein [Magallana gigas]|uniref:uncharacterized protein n=1 Tax=Magallana gigas TaxID=29159 RepID=UPI00333F4C7A